VTVSNTTHEQVRTRVQHNKVTAQKLQQLGQKNNRKDELCSQKLTCHHKGGLTVAVSPSKWVRTLQQRHHVNGDGDYIAGNVKIANKAM